MNSKVLIIAALVCVCLGRPEKLGRDDSDESYNYQPPSNSYSAPRASVDDEQSEEYDPIPYQYNFAVRDEDSGNDFSHKSDSDGSTVQGEYRVELPDGRTQIVKYYATKEEGFKAEVTYEGEARPYVAPVRSYEEPENSYEAPERTVAEPSRTYHQPEPVRTYEAPSQSSEEIELPEQTYQQPQQRYQAPVEERDDSFEEPEETYQAPQRTYAQPTRIVVQQPRLTYAQPRNTYNAPSRTYNANF